VLWHRPIATSPEAAAGAGRRDVMCGYGQRMPGLHDPSSFICRFGATQTVEPTRRCHPPDGLASTSVTCDRMRLSRMAPLCR